VAAPSPVSPLSAAVMTAGPVTPSDAIMMTGSLAVDSSVVSERCAV